LYRLVKSYHPIAARSYQLRMESEASMATMAPYV